MDKRKRILKIFVYGVLSQAITLLLGIILPKLFIVNYGSEVNGLLSSVRQIFVYVALLEAGVGTASLQAMYAPTANGDIQKLSEIMAATDHYYKRTGVMYGLAVIILALFYPVVIQSDIPRLVVAGVIIFQGASGVINYFFQGKFSILLRVDGKSYITTNAVTVAGVASKLIQIFLVLRGYNVLVVQLAYFVINLSQMLFITWYVKKHYAWLDLSVSPDYDALSQSKNVIVHQISGLIFNNTDILLLSYFCGLKVVSVYSLYNLIFTCVSSVIDTICSSVEFVLGQAFNSDRNYFMKLQEVYETYYLAVSFAFFTVTLIMIPSFIKLYSTGITDIAYVDPYLPILFVAINVLTYARRTSSQIINFAGHFKETQGRSIFESAINLTVSLIMVQKIGIYGVLLGTVAALLYRTNDIIIYANTRILNRKPWKTYRRWMQNLIVMIGCVTLMHNILPPIESYIAWAVNAVWVCFACFSISLLVNSILDLECFHMVKSLVSSTIKNRYRA